MRNEKNELQEKILQTAYDLFLEKGYNETTTREIAEHSGIERGHLYYYYSKKEDMLFGWYIQFVTSIYEIIVEKCAREGSGYVLMILFDLVYYKAIFLDQRLLRLLGTILENRAMTRSKIQHTCHAYQVILDDRQIAYDSREVYIATCILIGAEVELFLHMLDPDMEMGYEEFIDRIIDIHLDSFRLGHELRDEVKKKALSYLPEFDETMLKNLIKKTNTVQM